MNERIKRLAEEAGLLYPQIGPSVETRYMKKKEQEIERFADLIIMECAELSAGYTGNVKLLICNHFGIEP
jgi:hypothetical protein